MKTLRYSLFGLIVGATLGAILGSGQLFHRIITKQEMHADFASWRWTILGALCGTVIMGYFGIQADRNEKTKSREQTIAKQRTGAIRQALGLKPYPKADIHVEGLSWVAITKWSDPRDGREYMLKTYRNASGQLVTTLGTVRFVHEPSTSTDEEAVTSAHRQTRIMVFNRLIAAYEKDNQVAVENALV